MSPVEPSADIRAAAQQCRQLYMALVEQEFTTIEAIQIVIGVLKASITGQS